MVLGVNLLLASFIYLNALMVNTEDSLRTQYSPPLCAFARDNGLSVKG